MVSAERGRSPRTTGNGRGVASWHAGRAGGAPARGCVVRIVSFSVSFRTAAAFHQDARQCYEPPRICRHATFLIHGTSKRRTSCPWEGRVDLSGLTAIPAPLRSPARPRGYEKEEKIWNYSTGSGGSSAASSRRSKSYMRAASQAAPKRPASLAWEGWSRYAVKPVTSSNSSTAA